MSYTKDEILKVMNDLDDDSLVFMNNKFCEMCQWDDFIYPMDEFDEIMATKSPSELVRELEGSDFNLNNAWFRNDLSSANDVRELMGEAMMYDIANYCERNEETFGISELEDVLDGPGLEL